jgi:thioredoxin-dependent peroxiredoxin
MTIAISISASTSVSAITDFTLPTSGDSSFTLSAQKGKIVVLYFYPKDDTPGCTVEGQDFTAHYKAFTKTGAVVVGVSRDSVKSHDKFCTKYAFPFPLISDADELLCGMFGVMKMKNMYGKQVHGVERSTFVFDKTGALVKEWRAVKVQGHVDEVLAFVKSM